ncbi:MAG: hypothetical protein HQM13_07120 [SAR324 cluster bacterium]|nr:hypothetical protein [SAR324 cluster bacterium]
MKFTQYFIKNRQKTDHIVIQLEWIQEVIQNPLRKTIQKDGRIRLWGKIPEADNKFLRVVLLEDEETVHNAFFDRRFQEEL